MAETSPQRRPRAARTRAPAWSQAFLAALAATSNVSAAARKAGVSTSTVYELRRSNTQFFRAWQVALCEGYDNLELDLLARLRVGEIRPAPGAKKAVRSFDNATALRLLTAHRESVARERATRDNDDAEAILAGLNAKLDRMREQSLAANLAASLASGLATSKSAVSAPDDSQIGDKSGGDDDR